MSSYVHVSPSFNMRHLVLFLAYSEPSPAKHLKPPKLVKFVNLKQIMHRNIFIPTLFTKMSDINAVINDHQKHPHQHHHHYAKVVGHHPDLNRHLQ